MREHSRVRLHFNGASPTGHLALLPVDAPLGAQWCENGAERAKKVRPGEILVLPGRSAASLRAESDGTVVIVSFRERMLAFAQAQLGLAHAAALLSTQGANDPLARELICKLRDEARQRHEHNPRYAESLGLTLISHLVQRYSAPAETARNQTGGLCAAQLRRVTDFVEEQLDGDLSLQRLADKANLSVYHFARLFKRSTGVSPHDYITRRRVDRAKRLLVETRGVNTREIARKVGFCDPSHLSRHFRRVTGVGPREFLASIGGKEMT